MEAVRVPSPPLDARAAGDQCCVWVFVDAEVGACGTVCFGAAVTTKLPDQAAPAQLLAFRGLVAVVDARGIFLL